MSNWRENKKQQKTVKAKEFNRIKILLFFILFLSLTTVFRLYHIQIINGEMYSVLARGQQQISSQLKPSRGQIFINDFNSSGESRLYPLATNKSFAFVFAIPKDITEISWAEKIAESLFTVFDKERIEKEVEELIKEEEKKKEEAELIYVASLSIDPEEKEKKRQEVINRYRSFQSDPQYLELRQAKKDKEFDKRKQEIIEPRLKILQKENSLYASINKKVSEEDLLKLYALLLSEENKAVNENDLVFKQGKIFYADNEEEPLVLPGLSYTMTSYRFYPEKNIASQILGFVSNNIDDDHGKYGLEAHFDDLLYGSYGFVRSELGAKRDVIILNDREYIRPENGADIVLTLDRSVQFKVCEKLEQASKKYAADSGTVIVMDPFSGAIMAMCSWPSFDPNNYEKVSDIKFYNNPAIFDQYEPGSVFKVITMAAALDQEKVSPSTTYKDEGQMMIQGWHKPIRNSDYATRGGHGIADMNKVLELSLNTGAIFAMREAGAKTFAGYVENFGFGKVSGIELGMEGKGNISNLQKEKIGEIYAATASFGQGITVTPLQMLNSFAAIANGGILMKPYIVKEIHYPNGKVEKTEPKEIRRVISERTSLLLGGMLVNVVESGHAKLAAVEGYYVGGKTGTAQVASGNVRGYGRATVHNFVGYAPIDQPKYVMLVKFNNAKNVAFAASSAAPLFGEISEFLLNYYQVPKERKN